MADFGLGGIVASVLAGAAGGKAADKQPKTPSPGGLGSLLGGGAGGALGGLLTSQLATDWQAQTSRRSSGRQSVVACSAPSSLSCSAWC